MDASGIILTFYAVVSLVAAVAGYAGAGDGTLSFVAAFGSGFLSAAMVDVAVLVGVLPASVALLGAGEGTLSLAAAFGSGYLTTGVGVFPPGAGVAGFLSSTLRAAFGSCFVTAGVGVFAPGPVLI